MERGHDAVELAEENLEGRRVSLTLLNPARAQLAAVSRALDRRGPGPNTHTVPADERLGKGLGAFA